MKNRFGKKKRDFTLFKSIAMPVAFFALIAVLFSWGLTSLTATTQAEQLRSVQSAITRATVQCYAVEGQYPPNLKYLTEHYGVVADTDRYIIHYDVFASNIMPVITVLPKDFSQLPEDDFEMM